MDQRCCDCSYATFSRIPRLTTSTAGWRTGIRPPGGLLKSMVFARAGALGTKVCARGNISMPSWSISSARNGKPAREGRAMPLEGKLVILREERPEDVKFLAFLRNDLETQAWSKT